MVTIHLMLIRVAIPPTSILMTCRLIKHRENLAFFYHALISGSGVSAAVKKVYKTADA
jgi:hypothetical protein